MSLEDNYEIGSPLYVGQVATSYPAIEKASGRKVLLKVMHSHWVQDRELLERFNREGQALAGIEHTNIVKAFDLFREDGLPCLTLEWIDGGTLADNISSGPLPSVEVKRIAEAVLSGLQAVHEHGLLHRDLKPDNILLGNDGRILLADFSLAGFNNLKGLTGHGALVGSPAYMAPELIEGEDASQKSDLWGLGIVLLEALTGSNPYTADDPLVSLEKLRTIDPPKLIDRTSIDAPLAELIDALLQRNPDHRPKDATEAEALLKGEIQIPDMSDRSTRRSIHSAEKKKLSGSRVLWLLPIFILIIVIALKYFPANKQIEPQISDKTLDLNDSIYSTRTDSFRETINNDISTPAIKSLDTDSIAEDSLVTETQIKSAFLTLIVLPWAYITIDGEEVGVTPLGTLELEAGDHEITFTHDSFPKISRIINLEAEKHDTIRINLEVEAVKLNITAIPWGYLWIDSDSIGLLPRNEIIWALPGKHQIIIKHPEYRSLMDSLNLETGKKFEIRADFINGTMVAIN